MKVFPVSVSDLTPEIPYFKLKEYFTGFTQFIIIAVGGDVPADVSI